MRRARHPKNLVPDVVAAVELQTAAAAGLASISGQDRLTDPRTNPAVRPLADKLRDEQQRHFLTDQNTRLLRRGRVYNRRAEGAERAIEALAAARGASSPARSVLALHQGRGQFMAATLAASLTLSAASAIGVAALAVKLDAPAEIGYCAEIGLTGLTTTVILYRSHLAQHDGQVHDWRDKVLWALMVCPLLASMVANAYGTGGIGVTCSAGAAAFSLLSYVIADASAEALRDQAARVSETDEQALRDIATGDNRTEPPNVPTSEREAPRRTPRTEPSTTSPRRWSLTYTPAQPMTTVRLTNVRLTKAITAPSGHFAKTIIVATPPVTTVTAPTSGHPTGDHEPLLTGQPTSELVTELTNNHRMTAEPVADHKPGHENDQHLPDLANHPTDQANDQTAPVTASVPDRSGDQVTAPETTAPPTGHQAGAKPTARKKPGPDADQNTKAVKVYQDSVTAGQPLSQRELAAIFGRSSGWGHARIKEAGLTVVGQPVTVVSGHQSDDRASDESDRLGSAVAR